MKKSDEIKMLNHRIEELEGAIDEVLFIYVRAEFFER